MSAESSRSKSCWWVQSVVFDALWFLRSREDRKKTEKVKEKEKLKLFAPPSKREDRDLRDCDREPREREKEQEREREFTFYETMRNGREQEPTLRDKVGAEKAAGRRQLPIRDGIRPAETYRKREKSRNLTLLFKSEEKRGD